MKTLKTFTFLILLLSAHFKLSALTPLITYTFVNPCMPFASFQAISNTYGCYSFSATNAGNIDPNAYYTWNFGDGTTATGANVYHCYAPAASPGPGPGPIINFVVTLAYNSVPCGTTPTQNTYTVTLNPPASGQCISNPPTVSITALTATVWGGMAIPEIMFQYKFGDGTAPTMSTNVHTYAHCGNYIVGMKSWDMNMPQDTCYGYQAVNMACAAGTVTGIEDHSQDKVSVKLFPNPSSELINLKSNKLINGIKVVDVTGRVLVIKNEIREYQFILQVAEYQAGSYFLKCSFNDGSETNLKFTKK